MTQTEKLGTKSYYCLETARFRLDGGAMYGIIPKPLWEKCSPPDEQNRIDLALRMMVIQSPAKTVLIDTGIGDYHPQKFEEMFDIREAFSEAKNLFKLDSVTDVIISHLHFDHAGGLIKKEGEKFTCAFPQAKIHLHKAHYQYSLNPSSKDSGSFHSLNYKPVLEDLDRQGRIIWHEGESGTLIEELGLHFITSHGHTPHLMHPMDQNFIYMADLVPTSHHVHLPWIMAYDMMPGVSALDKERFYKVILEKNLTMIFEHDPECWGSQLTQIKPGKYEVKNASSCPKWNKKPTFYPIRFLVL